jgi:hypothetical protein
VFVARNGVFLEKEFLKKEKCRQKVYLEEVQDEPLGEDHVWFEDRLMVASLCDE